MIVTLVLNGLNLIQRYENWCFIFVQLLMNIKTFKNKYIKIKIKHLTYVR